MSRHRRETDQASTPEPAPAPTATDPPAEGPRSRVSLAVGIAIWLIWMVGLVSLASLSSNPPALNRRQIANADLVVIAKVADVVEGRVEIESIKYGKIADKQLTITDLDRVPQISNGATYIMPLKRSDHQYRVVSIASDSQRPVVYRATGETESQLADVLQDISRRLAP